MPKDLNALLCIQGGMEKREESQAIFAMNAKWEEGQERNQT